MSRRNTIRDCAALGEIALRPVELWFVRNGLLDQVAAWYRTLGHANGLVYVADAAERGESVPDSMVVMFETPISAGVDVVGFDRQRMPIVGEWSRDERLIVTPAGVAIAPEPFAVWAALSQAIRDFALLPFVERHSVELDYLRAATSPDDRQPSPIVVVRWRRTTYLPADDPTAQTVEWSHRWIVSAHLRRLADGRLTFVREHVKGPADRPLVVKRRVNELGR